MTPTHREIVVELRRELQLRKRCYPEWIKAGRLKTLDAEHRIACMEAAFARFEAELKGGEQQGFFNDDDGSETQNPTQKAI